VLEAFSAVRSEKNGQHVCHANHTVCSHHHVCHEILPYELTIGVMKYTFRASRLSVTRVFLLLAEHFSFSECWVLGFEIVLIYCV